MGKLISPYDIKRGDFFTYLGTDYTALSNATGESNTYVDVEDETGTATAIVIRHGNSVTKHEYGTGEEPLKVPARDIRPGVQVSGDRFNTYKSLIVQSVREYGGKVEIIANDFEGGPMLERWFNPRTEFETWGKL